MNKQNPIKPEIVILGKITKLTLGGCMKGKEGHKKPNNTRD